MALILPIAPFKEEHLFTRENKNYKAVKGINDQGYAYMWIQEEQLEDELVAKWVPVDQNTVFKHGVNIPLGTYWEKELYNSVGKYIKTVEGSRIYLETNHPDMIFFTAGLGIKMLPHFFNGFIRAILGHDEQPLFDDLGTRIPDTNYDVTLPPSNTYYNHVAEEEVSTTTTA